jgi:hypothetical protein
MVEEAEHRTECWIVLGLDLPALQAPNGSGWAALEKASSGGFFNVVDERERDGYRREGGHTPRDRGRAQSESPEGCRECDREDEEAALPRVIGERQRDECKPQKRRKRKCAREPGEAPALNQHGGRQADSHHEEKAPGTKP